MPTLQDLLTRGFFPKELPPPFTTESFASHMVTAPLSGDFAKAITGKVNIKPSKPVRYSLARGGLQRRPLSLCHPVPQFLLSKEIVENWADIVAVAGGTEISATNPEAKQFRRAIDGRLPQSKRVEQAQLKRLGRRFVLQADISRFYSSIYTHSIPWAMHGKNISKANHKLTLLGNRIDFLVRLGQDSQTIGIPIGPDTSLVIAEMIMHKCDKYLAARLPSLQGFRFIDDFELGFMSQAEAENAHYLLETCLADFELALNPKKTSIRELPLPLEAPWATELKRAKPRPPGASQSVDVFASQQGADLVHLFDIATEQHKRYPDESVLQFAISLLSFEKIEDKNWLLFQRLMMLASLPEPACFPGAIRQIVLRINSGQVGLIPEIAQIANALIVTHSPLRHSSEVANAAYACLALGLTMSNEAVDAISKCDDPVVALLALDCEQRQLTAKPLDKSIWMGHMKAKELYDEFWLLAYEANVKGWLPNNGGTDFVDLDLNFSPLKAAGVYFYNDALNLPTAPTIPSVAPMAVDSSAPLQVLPPLTTQLPAELAPLTPPEEIAAPTDSQISS